MKNSGFQKVIQNTLLAACVSCAPNNNGIEIPEDTGIEVEDATDRTLPTALVFDNTRRNVGNALNGALEYNKIMEEENRRWNLVIDKNPAYRDPNNIRQLFVSPSSEFLDYLALWGSYELGVEPLYRRGLLNSAANGNSYPEYMNLELDYERFSRYINGVLEYIDESNEFDAENAERYRSSRLAQYELINRLFFLSASESGLNNSNRYLQTPFIVTGNSEIEGMSRFESAALDPYLAIGVMMKETFPGDLVNPIVKYRVMQAMLQSGYNPNYKISTDSLAHFEGRLSNGLRCIQSNSNCTLGTTQHLVVGFPHFTFRTATELIEKLHNGNNPLNVSLGVLTSRVDNSEVEGRIPVELLAEQFGEILGDQAETTKLFYSLNLDNLSRYETYAASNPSLNAYLSNERNYLSFVAIAMYFQFHGGSLAEFDNINNMLQRTNYNQDRFLNLLSSNSAYVRDVLQLYRACRELQPQNID